MAQEKSCKWLDRNPGENKSVRKRDELGFGNVSCKRTSVKAQWQAMKTTLTVLSSNGFNSQS